MYIVKSGLMKLSSMVACCAVFATSAKLNRRSEDDFECPENWGYYEDPENCIKYYNCEFGEAHSVTCRSGNMDNPKEIFIVGYKFKINTNNSSEK